MRTTTASELLTLAAATRKVTWRVKVKNGSGTYIDLSNWVERINIHSDVDLPVSACTIEFVRASGTTLSLSPLRTDSTLNRLDDGTTYSPQLDAGRGITVEVATTGATAAVVSGDYKMLFIGNVDVVSFDSSPVTIQCRDLGYSVADRWIETVANYGTTAGRAMESVMQDILDAVYGAGIVVLNCPVSPSYNIVTYQQQKMSVIDALQQMAQLTGWDVRYRYDTVSNGFKLTLQDPNRAKTTPDYTFGPSAYFAVHRLDIDGSRVRNAIDVTYFNATTKVKTTTAMSTDGTSITKYSRQYFGIQEAGTSPIDTNTEAVALAGYALADLKDPKATQEIELPFFWPGDLGDLYRFTANGIHYDTNQDWAVVTLSHDLSNGKHRSTIAVRGSPCGQYLTWLVRGGLIPGNRMPGNAHGPYLQATANDGSTNTLTSFNPQGSGLPTSIAIINFAYNCGGPATNRMWAAFTWSTITAYRPDGSALTIPGSASYPTPPSPTLSTVVSGALGGRTVFVRIGYIKNHCIFKVGAEASIVCPANSVVKVTSPTAVAGYDGWIALMGVVTNTEYAQTETPFGSDFTESVTGFNSTTTSPYDNTFWPNAVIARELPASTAVFWYPYYDISFTFVALASRGQTAKNDVDAATQNADGRYPLSFGAISLTTPAGAGTNSGNASNGGQRLL